MHAPRTYWQRGASGALCSTALASSQPVPVIIFSSRATASSSNVIQSILRKGIGKDHPCRGSIQPFQAQRKGGHPVVSRCYTGKVKEFDNRNACLKEYAVDFPSIGRIFYRWDIDAHATHAMICQKIGTALSEVRCFRGLQAGFATGFEQYPRWAGKTLRKAFTFDGTGMPGAVKNTAFSDEIFEWNRVNALTLFQHVAGRIDMGAGMCPEEYFRYKEIIGRNLAEMDMRVSRKDCRIRG